MMLTPRELKLSFSKRWNIDLPNNKKRFEDFRNRIQLYLSYYISEYSNNKILCEVVINYCYYASLDLDRFFIGHTIDTDEFFNDLEDRNDISFLKNIDLFVYLCNEFFEKYTSSSDDINFKKEQNIIFNNIYNTILDAIECSLVQINLHKTPMGLLLYPKGAKLLDQDIINNDLDWLEAYPIVYKSFASALKKYMNNEYTRNLIDDLRHALEMLCKCVLKNEKSLENQKGVLGSFLEEKGISKETRNMFCTLISHYTTYNNEHVKHGDTYGNQEIEFLVYLTGTFMRLLLTL